MMRTQISLEKEMYRRAQAEARKQGISLAELVRRALASVLAPTRASDRPWMKWSGAIRGGDARSSDPDRIDAVVYGQKP
jgi:lambda repressor-like predicted transcriptional regulator